MPEIKTPLKHCPDYDEHGDEAWIIEPTNSVKDVLRWVCKDTGPDLFIMLAREIYDEEAV